MSIKEDSHLFTLCTAIEELGANKDSAYHDIRNVIHAVFEGGEKPTFTESVSAFMESATPEQKEELENKAQDIFSQEDTDYLLALLVLRSFFIHLNEALYTDTCSIFEKVDSVQGYASFAC